LLIQNRAVLVLFRDDKPKFYRKNPIKNFQLPPGIKTYEELDQSIV
jgi:hypothetical protein